MFIVSLFFCAEDAVERSAEWLTDTFNNMVACTEDALEESKANPKKIVNIIQRKDKNFTYVSGEFFDSLRTAVDILDLFYELDKYWDPLNYFLLERLLLRPATKRLFAKDLTDVYDDLYQRMLHYKKEIEYFRKHTEVKVYCSRVLKPKPEDVPPGFKKLVKERDLETLEDVELFRQEVAYEYKLFDCLVFLKKIVCGSLILTFWIPSQATLSGMILGVGDDEGSSVDPIIIRDGAQVTTTYYYSNGFEVSAVKVEWCPLDDPQEQVSEGAQQEQSGTGEKMT